MKYLLVLFVLIASASIAHAADTTLTCIAPTQNTDNSPLTNLAGYNLYGALQGQPKAKLDTKTVAQGCSFVRQNVAVGTHEYYVTAFNTLNLESPPSGIVTAVVLPPPDADGDGVPDSSDQCPAVKGVPPTGCPLVPKPPTSVQSQVTAYEYRPATNSMAMIGIVQPGTACSNETKVISAKTYSAIPYDPKTVDYYNSPQVRTPPLKVWAICEAPLVIG